MKAKTRERLWAAVMWSALVLTVLSTFAVSALPLWGMRTYLIAMGVVDMAAFWNFSRLVKAGRI